MTVLAPWFLLALLAVPLLIWLARQRQRPLTRVVPAVELWALTVGLAATQATPKRRLDWAWWLRLLAVVAAVLAAAHVSCAESHIVPRRFVAVVDRSFGAQWPTVSGVSALTSMHQWLANFASQLPDGDTLDVRWVPALTDGDWRHAPPEALASDLSGARFAQAVIDATHLAGITCVLALHVADQRWRIPAQVGTHAWIDVPFAVKPCSTWIGAAVSAEGIWVELANPSSHELTVWPATPTNTQRAPEPLLRHRLSKPRTWIPLAKPISEPVEIEVSGAWPAIRGFALWRRRVGLMLTGLEEPTVKRFVNWLAVVAPTVEPRLIRMPSDANDVEALILAASTNTPHGIDLPLAITRRMPTLVIGRPLNPFVTFDTTSRLPLGDVRHVVRPDHPLLAGVEVTELDWRDVAWPVDADGVESDTVLQAQLQTGVPVRLLTTAIRDGRQAVVISSLSPITDWPTQGVAGAAVIGNALSWLLKDPALITNNGRDLTDVPVGAGAALGELRSFDRRLLPASPQRAGWVCDRRGGRILTAQNPTAEAVGVEPEAVFTPTPDSVFERLPRRESASYVSMHVAWLLVALAATLALFARHRERE